MKRLNRFRFGAALLLGSLSVLALGAASADRFKNDVIVGNGVAGTKTLSFDIGGSNPSIESVAGVLKASTDGTNFMIFPAAADTIVGKATTDILTNKSIGGAGATFNGSTSGGTILKATAIAASTTLTLPAATDTLVGLATTDTLTNKTLTSPKLNENVAVTTTATKLNYLTSAAGTTGTASTNVVFSTSPTIATPAFTGAMTATGALTTTSSSALNNLFIANGSNTTNQLTVRTGNGTTSGRNAFTEYDSSETSGQTWDIGMVGDQTLNFYNQTAGSTRGSVDSAGKWDFGTTTADVGHIFRNSSQVSNYVLTLRNYSTNSGSEGLYGLSIVKGTTTNTSTQKFILFNINAGGTQSGGIAANGASAAAFVSVSDRRLKKNIVDLPPQLANIRALKPVEFDYKDGSGHQIGQIAQDIQKVYPDAVSEDERTGMLSIVGWGKTEARLVKALQELADRNDALAARVGELEKKVALMEASPKK